MLPDDFDWEVYISINDDVKQCFPTEELATNHYLSDGIKQNRIYKTNNVPDDFNWESYLILNPDVFNHYKDKLGAIQHFELFGYNEGRQRTLLDSDIPEDFCWMIYLYYNPELKQVITSEIEAKSHYITEGKEANLKYIYLDSEVPEDFDWVCYTEINTDLKQSFNSKLLAQFHYIITGKNEQRIYKFNHTPDDFDIKSYLELNPSIHEKYKINEYTVKIHYDVIGHPQKLPYKLNTTNIPVDFDCEKYIELNPDLQQTCSSDILCKQHYINYGIYQNRNFKENNNDRNNSFNSYPFLFHKYLLNITQEKKTIDYDIIFETKFVTPSTIVAHLHCYNINKFREFFTDEYIVPISEYCSHIIITYSIGNNIVDLPKKNVTCIKTDNRGMDIGGKYICIDFLKTRKYKYDSILFLHSKTDNYMRRLYWDPLVKNIRKITRYVIKNKEFGIFVPPLIYMGDYATIVYKDNFVNPDNVISKWNFGNSLYMNDIDRYFNYDPANFLFPEGNCFVATREIAENLYGNTNLYNLLNDNLTMDAAWVKSLYGSRGFHIGNNIQEIYDFFKKEGNNTNVFSNNIAWGAGHKGHADNMYEHSYERIVFKVVQHVGLKIKIMSLNTDTNYIKQLEDINDKINNIIKPIE